MKDDDEGAGQDFRLSDSPGHLLRLALQRSGELFSEQLGTGGLTLRQFMVLLAVRQRPGSTQTDLVEATGIDRSTMGEMLDRLVKRGFLARRRSSQDQRANLVDLMEPGMQALVAAIPAARQTQERLLEALTPEQRQLFVDMLGRIAGISAPPAAASQPSAGERSPA